MRAFLSLILISISICHISLKGDQDRPNILFAIADDWSFGHAGAYGCSWVKTPAFDRIAEEGLLFQNAYTPNAKCAPSRATILTGRYSWQLEEAGNHVPVFPPKFGGFMERLAADGYVAGYTGKGWGPGTALKTDGTRRAITGKGYSKRKLKPIASGISVNDYAGNFGDFLNDTTENQPWLFWYGTTEPHRGYEFKSGVRLGKKLSQIDRVPSYWPDNETSRHDMLDYGIEVE
ncbi:MAG: sulfatase-like hydrolase/transferase, partial [Verrucomicrobia bacterium]|nr:sulfatase-like hydrolase/transferase [Verrucomicrobiota bacterium]